MTTVVDVDLLADLKKFGAADVSACFSCGNCTATCLLADNDATFPRRMIRYAQVGLKDELLGSKELWACYGCALCSQSCPTKADPGEFMAAARRYAIASYEPTGLARVIYTRPRLGLLIGVLVAAVLATFMLTQAETKLYVDLHNREHPQAVFDMHQMGRKGVRFMVPPFIDPLDPNQDPVIQAGFADVGTTIAAKLTAAGKPGVATHIIFDNYSPSLAYGNYHGSVDLLSLELLGVKATGTAVPIWYPSRLLGTVAGLSLMYGVTLFMVGRWRRWSATQATSTGSDWMLLTLLWITGLTGFAIEVALYAGQPPAWGYWVFLLHVAVAMELMLMLPFTKFAHVMYRPVALFFYALAKRA